MADDEMNMLCRMVIDTAYESLSSTISTHAKHAILDTLAVTIGGSALEGVRTVVEFVKDKGGRPESYIPIYGGKVPASEAGLAIGPMSRAMDFGDLHMIAGHCSEYVLPALLAAVGLKKRVTGKEFITAFVVGSEVLIRTGLFATPGKSLSVGRDGGHYIFGTVAAVGKLLGLSLDELLTAQGIAAEMTQPHSALMYHPPTLMIRIHHGFVCQDAINACLLAKRGITASRTGVLTGPGGYSSFISWDKNPDRNVLTDGLGREWKQVELTRKRYPIAGSASTPIDGLLRQMREHSIRAGDIARIQVDLDSRLAERVTKPSARDAQWNPQTVHDCQFSVPYGLAIAAYTGDVFVDSYTPEMRFRKDVRDLMTRIELVADAQLPPYAARINTTLTNGEKFMDEFLYPSGHPKRPLTELELIDKFRKCARYSAVSLSAQATQSVIDSVLKLEGVPDFSNAVIAPLTPAGVSRIQPLH